MLIKKKLNKLMSVFLATTIFVGGSVSSISAANKSVTIPTKSNYKHVSIIGKNRADTSNIIVSNSNSVNNYILVNQYKGLSYALMNSANAAKIGAYILPINSNNIPEELQHFSASNESITKIKVSGNSSSFDQNFLNNELGIYASLEKNIINDLSKASVDNLNKNFKDTKTVFIVNADKGIADAMSIAPVSYRDKTPILFTTKDGKSINGYSKKSGVKYIAVGGNAVVSDSLVKKFGAIRIAGNNRYETNKAVLKRYYPNRKTAYFTNGDTLVDALSSVHMTKNDGIVLVNKSKNHDLLRNINTYQIGGVKGYDFKYKDEKGKFITTTKLSAKKKTPENNATTRYRVYKHKINMDDVTGTFISKPNKNVKILMQALRDRKRVFTMDGEEFKEIYNLYSKSYTSLPASYNIIDGNKIYLAYAEEYLKEYLATLDLYKAEVKRALSGMNLNCSNDEMLKQINRYIENNYKYKIIDGRPIDMIKNHEGQCMHYAMLFNNMCAAVGIDVDYVEGEALGGEPHAWNRGVFDGKMYYFDTIFSNGDDNQAMWSEKNIHQKIHVVY